jgi:hypothetical protein
MTWCILKHRVLDLISKRLKLKSLGMLRILLTIIILILLNNLIWFFLA